MHRASSFSAGAQLLACILALLFVVPADVAARMCVSIAAQPMACCVMPPGDWQPGPKPCCCTNDDASSGVPATAISSSIAVRLAAANPTQAKVHAPEGCCCAKPEGKDAALPLARDPCPSNAGDLGAWIAERAQISARAVCAFTPSVRTHSDCDGPPTRGPGFLCSTSASSSAIGCARRDLLSRGVIGLLTDFGIALL